MESRVQSVVCAYISVDAQVGFIHNVSRGINLGTRIGPIDTVTDTDTENLP